MKAVPDKSHFPICVKFLGYIIKEKTVTHLKQLHFL